MLGQNTASLEDGGRRWLHRIWGCPDIHTRQKWMALRPYLNRLPTRGVRLLDAGCGMGRWALELAAMRPHWSVAGVDLNANFIRRAESARHRLGLTNVAFFQSDFLHFQPDHRFDIVLSVSSTHYLVEMGKGMELFRCLRSWLCPGGCLILLGPRRESETPLVSWLPHPGWHNVFSLAELSELCAANGLNVEVLSGRIGRLGTLGKQLSWVAGAGHFPVKLTIYLLGNLLTFIDARTDYAPDRHTLMWLLFARATS
jgi:SAM-dependent methyltransferase